MQRYAAVRSLFVALVAFVSLTGAAVFAADAPRDSVLFPAQTPEGSIGRFSLWQETKDDGNVVYGGSAVLNGTDKLRWSAEMSPDLTRLLVATMYVHRGEMEIQGHSTLKPEGGEPELVFYYNGNKVPAPIEKLPAKVLYAPMGAPTGFAPLSDLLSNVDAATYSYDGKASDGMNLFDITVRGKGVGEVEVRGKTVPVRSFDVTVQNKQMAEPQAVVLHQYEDGTFFGVASDGITCFALGGSPSDSAVSNNAEVLIDVAGGALAGVLAVPKDQVGPFPGVIMVPAAGQDREASNGSFALFSHLADELSTMGVATLRIDPRAGTPSDLAADVAAACRVLADHPDVDGSKLVVLGHGSAGACLGEAAVLAVADSLGVGGIALLGASTLPTADGYDPRVWYKQAGLPMIVLHGALDREVSVDEAPDFKAWMMSNGIRGPVVMPKTMNHYLQTAVTGETDEYPTLAAECGSGVAKKLNGFIRSATR